MRLYLLLPLVGALLSAMVLSLCSYASERIVAQQDESLAELILTTTALLSFGFCCMLGLCLEERSKRQKTISPITEAKELGFEPIGKIIVDRDGKFSSDDMKLISYSYSRGVGRLKRSGLSADLGENFELGWISQNTRGDLFKTIEDVIIVHPELLIRH